MDRWTEYLFEGHSEAELRDWARRLNFFRFFRAFGGHANDTDSLDVVFAYNTLEDLESFLRRLGVELFKFDVEPSQPEPGVSYRGDVFAQFPSLIGGTRWIRQPGHCDVLGEKAFIWCHSNRVKISLGSDYTVSEKDIRSAERIEKALTDVGLERIDPPFDTRNYICPKHYPDFYAGLTAR